MIGAGLLLGVAVSAGAPILLAGLGELVAERAGVLNLGVEGMMLVGALAGFAGARATGDLWAGVACAAAAGAALAAVHALPAAWLKVDQVVSGLALVILGDGLTRWFGRGLVGQVAPSFEAAPIPGLSGLPLVGPALFNHDPLVYLSLLLTAAVGAGLAWTRPGLSLQLCGENPALADLSGVSVARTRVLATLFGGAMAGLGGAWLSLADTPSWVDGMTTGRGWIALAMVIFAGWSPARLALGAWLFGGLVALQFRAQTFGLEISVYLLKALPYLLTLAVLILASRGRWRHRLGAPAALGTPYTRGER